MLPDMPPVVQNHISGCKLNPRKISEKFKKMSLNYYSLYGVWTLIFFCYMYLPVTHKPARAGKAAYFRWQAISSDESYSNI
jgi:hypothetical protein